MRSVGVADMERYLRKRSRLCTFVWSVRLHVASSTLAEKNMLHNKTISGEYL